MENISSNKLVDDTLKNYEFIHQEFWDKTKNLYNVQNYQLFLSHIKKVPPYRILDLGCGPGRDLKYFAGQGHNVIGVDGCSIFCQMARNFSGQVVLHQNFLDLNLPKECFDGVYANASIFHIPRRDFVSVIKKLNLSLKREGIFFLNNPTGCDEEKYLKEKYVNYMGIDLYKSYVEQAGFELVAHNYNFGGNPIVEKFWLACLFKKINKIKTDDD